MKTYTAVDRSGLSIISVGADSLTEARVEIQKQLARPGRSQYIPRWTQTMRRLTKFDLAEVADKEWLIEGKPVQTSYILDILKTGGVVIVDAII